MYKGSKTLIIILICIHLCDALYPRDICRKPINERDQTSFEFLVCEGNQWSAPHITLPMAVTIYVQNLWLALLLPGLAEAAEVLLLTTIDNFILVKTNESQKETIAGALLGDWIFNGFMGVLLGFMIVYIMETPPLLPEWKNTKGNRWIFWKHLLFFILFALTWTLPTFTIPSGCEEVDRFSCNHLGLLILIIIRPFMLYLLYYILSRSKDDEKMLWQGYPIKARFWFFVLWYVVEATIHIQNLQNWIPLYLGNAGGFFQPWLQVGFWILFFILVIIYKVGDIAYFNKTYLGSVDWRKGALFIYRNKIKK